MDNQTSSVNPRDEWVEFPTQDEPFGESETNGGDFRLTEKPRNACQLIPETESIFATMDSSGVNVATTKLPGQFPASQTGAGSDIMDNQLRATFQHNIESSQGSRGVAPYPPLSRGLGGSRSDVEHMPNTLGSGANMPTGPYVTDRASGGVQAMPWTQAPSNSASVHHPETRERNNSSSGVATLAGIGRPATGAERINGGAIMVPLSSLNGPFTTCPAMDGMRSLLGPISANEAGSTLGSSQPAISQDGSRMEEETTTGIYERGLQHAASEASTNKVNRALPTATGRSLGPLLPVDSENDLTRLKAHLVENGAYAEAVNLCDGVFKGGISKAALLKRLTREQCRRLHLRDGKQFQVFLEKVEVTGGKKNRCRLCPENDAVLYKNHRDALRHFFKDHFGLWFECTQCEHKAFTNPELTRHVKISHGVIRDA